MPDGTLYNWIVTGLLLIGGGVIAWLMNRAIGRIDDDLTEHSKKLDEHDKQHAACSLELAYFKTEVARDYAKDSTMQQSLARVHDKLEEGFKELRNDIRLLGKIK